jgi:hypothetical protein
MVTYNGRRCKPTRSSNYIKLLIFLINIFLVNFSVCVVTFQVLIFLNVSGNMKLETLTAN